MMKTILNFSKPFVLLLMLLVSNILLAQTPLSGTYSIDPSGSGDYLSFSLAVADLDTSGVSGPVIFEAVNGTYNEQIQLGSVAGMDTNNTVTFRSQSGSASNVMVSYTGTGTSDNFVFKISGANNYKFKNLSFTNADTTYGRTIDLWDADSIWFDSCAFNSSGTQYTSDNIYIYSYNNGAYASCHNFKLTNSEIVGGYRGIYTLQYYTDKAEQVVIANNEFVNSYYTGAYIAYSKNIQFTNNHLISNSVNSNGYGFYFHTIEKGSISNNFVEGTSVFPKTGMYFFGVDGDLSVFMPLVNNRIFLPNPIAEVGLRLENCIFTECSYNSIFMEGGNLDKGIFLQGGGYNMLHNNISQVMGINAISVYLIGQSVYQMDNNAFSAPNGNVGYKGTAQATLNDWIAATGFDSNSVELINVYSDSSTLKVCTDSLYGKGVFTTIYVVPTTTDFEGEARQNPPCIGADEFMPVSEFGFDNQTLCNGDTLALTQDYFDTVVWNMIDTAKTNYVTSIGSQIVEVFGFCGSALDTFNVIAQQVANISDTNLCPFTITILETGISNATYLWNNGSTDSTFYVNTAQIVWVTVLDSVGCTSSDTAIITQSINVNLPDSATFCEGGSVSLDAIVSGTYLWSTGDTSQVISVSNTGYYSVSVTDYTCLSNDSVFVKEVLNPIADFCSVQNNLTVVFKNLSQIATTYLWDFGDGTTSTQESPSHIYPWTTNYDDYYDVKLVSVNQCSIDSVVQSVHVDQYGQPTRVISAHKNNLWTVSLNLTNTSGGSFLWDFDDGSTSTSSNPTHTYSSANAYECYSIKVKYEDCFSSDYHREISMGNYPASNPCNIIDGIQNTQIAASSIEIYPNPNKGVFTIKIEQAAIGNLNIEVLDAIGRVALRKEFGNVQGDFKKEINLAEAAPGIYFVRVILNNESAVYRIVVE